MIPPSEPHRFDVELGARVRVLREMQQMSLDALGAAIGVGGEQIESYERGVNVMPGACLIGVANALGVKLSIILGATEDPLESELIDQIGAASRQAGQVAQAFDRIADPCVRSHLAELVGKLGQPHRV